MFAECIRDHIHPATWAVVGLKKDALGQQFSHRGTAFALDASGHLLTCWHVTYMDKECQTECDDYLVLQPELGPARYSATLVAKDKDRDIALLKIAGDVKTKPVQVFGGTAPLGRSCCSFGHPLTVVDAASGSMRMFTRAAGGIVSMPFQASIWPGSRPVSLYELDFFTHPGSSGGPVFLRNGNVIAFVQSSRLLDDGTGKAIRSNLSNAVSIREAIEFLKPLDINVKVRGGAR